MPSGLLQFLNDQPLIKVLRGLALSSDPRHIRDLSSQYKLSPGGVSDIIRRLKRVGALKQHKQKNRICYSLKLEDDELACLKDFFLTEQKIHLRERALRYSKNALSKFEWIDEAQAAYKNVKKPRR